jgi:hypothetical protein
MNRPADEVQSQHRTSHAAEQCLTQEPPVSTGDLALETFQLAGTLFVRVLSREGFEQPCTNRHSGQREVGILDEAQNVTRVIGDGCHADAAAHILRGREHGNIELLDAQ